MVEYQNLSWVFYPSKANNNLITSSVLVFDPWGIRIRFTIIRHADLLQNGGFDNTILIKTVLASNSMQSYGKYKQFAASILLWRMQFLPFEINISLPEVVSIIHRVTGLMVSQGLFSSKPAMEQVFLNAPLVRIFVLHQSEQSVIHHEEVQYLLASTYRTIFNYTLMIKASPSQMYSALQVIYSVVKHIQIRIMFPYMKSNDT